MSVNDKEKTILQEQKDLVKDLSYDNAYQDCISQYNEMSNFPDNSMFMSLGLGLSGLMFLLGKRFKWSVNARTFPMLIGGFVGVAADRYLCQTVCEKRIEKLGLKKIE